MQNYGMSRSVAGHYTRGAWHQLIWVQQCCQGRRRVDHHLLQHVFL